LNRIEIKIETVKLQFMRALIVFLVMLCSCYSQEEINPQMELSVSDEQLIVTFTGGGLYSSTDLKSWSFVTTESPYKTSFVEEKIFYNLILLVVELYQQLSHMCPS